MYGILSYIWAMFGVNVGKYSSTMEHLGYTLWLFHIAMENGSFIDGLPTKNGGSFHGYVSHDQVGSISAGGDDEAGKKPTVVSKHYEIIMKLEVIKPVITYIVLTKELTDVITYNMLK